MFSLLKDGGFRMKKILALIMTLILIVCMIPVYGSDVYAKQDSVIGQDAEVGESVYIGTYPQSRVDDEELIEQLDERISRNSNKVILSDRQYIKYNNKWYLYEPIEWIVLEVSGESAFLLSKK